MWLFQFRNWQVEFIKILFIQDFKNYIIYDIPSVTFIQAAANLQNEPSCSWHVAVSVLVPEPAVRIIIHPGFQELIINFYIIYDVPAISQLFLFTGKMPQFLKMDQVVAGM